jgi:hypothetical protein
MGAGPHVAATWEHIGLSGDFLWDRAVVSLERAGRSVQPDGAGWPLEQCSPFTLD